MAGDPYRTAQGTSAGGGFFSQVAIIEAFVNAGRL